MAVIELDNRGLDAPEPLLRILDALSEMVEGDRLIALIDREPMLLYPLLEQRGYLWTIVEEPEGWYRIEIGHDL